MEQRSSSAKSGAAGESGDRADGSPSAQLRDVEGAECKDSGKQSAPLASGASPMADRSDYAQSRALGAEAKTTHSQDNEAAGTAEKTTSKSRRKSIDGDAGKKSAHGAAASEQANGHSASEGVEMKGGREGAEHHDSEAADGDESDDDDAHDKEDHGAPTKEKRMPKTNRLYTNPEFVSGQAGHAQAGIGPAALVGGKSWVGAKWTAEEDDILIDYVEKYGPTSWSSVAWRTNKQFNRGAEACKKRWSRLQAKMRQRGENPPGPPSKRRRKIVPPEGEDKAAEQPQEKKGGKTERDRGAGAGGGGGGGGDEARGRRNDRSPEAESSGGHAISRARGGDEEVTLRTAKLEDITKRGEKGEGAPKWGEDINRNLKKFLKDDAAAGAEGHEAERKESKKENRTKMVSKGGGEVKKRAQVKVEEGGAEEGEREEGRFVGGNAAKEGMVEGGWNGGSGKPSIDLNVDLNDIAASNLGAPGDGDQLSAVQAGAAPSFAYLQGGAIHPYAGASNIAGVPLNYPGIAFPSHANLRAIRPASQSGHPRPHSGAGMYPGAPPLAPPVPSWLPTAANQAQATAGAATPGTLVPCSNAALDPDSSRNETSNAGQPVGAPSVPSAPQYPGAGPFLPAAFPAPPPLLRGMGPSQAGARGQPPSGDAAHGDPLSPSQTGGGALGLSRYTAAGNTSLMAPPTALRQVAVPDGGAAGVGALGGGAGLKAGPGSAGGKLAEGESKVGDALSDHSGVTGTPSGSKLGGSKQRAPKEQPSGQGHPDRTKGGDDPVSDVSEAATVLVSLYEKNKGSVEAWQGACLDQDVKPNLTEVGPAGAGAGTAGALGNGLPLDEGAKKLLAMGGKALVAGANGNAQQGGMMSTLDTCGAMQKDLESLKQRWGQMRAERQDITRQKLEALEGSFSERRHKKTGETLRAVKALWEEWAGECDKINREQERLKEVVFSEDREAESLEEELEQRWRTKQKDIVSFLERQLALARSEPSPT